MESDGFLSVDIFMETPNCLHFVEFFRRRHYVHHVQNYINPRCVVLSVDEEINFLIPTKCHNLSIA